MSNPYHPFRREFARESLYVITEHDEVFADRKLYHCYRHDEHLGAWPEPPRTEGPLAEEFAAGRVLYRATLPDGREMVVPSVAWTGGCCCPSRFAPGGGCVGCSAAGRTESQKTGGSEKKRQSDTRKAVERTDLDERHAGGATVRADQPALFTEGQ